ncbi:MAG: pectate lyase [Prevotella sp.]|jgi:pectinesterase
MNLTLIKSTLRKCFATSILLTTCLTVQAQYWKDVMKTKDPNFFKTEEARRIGEQILLFQRVTGGWPKNVDMVRLLNEKEKKQVVNDKKRRNDSTTDNNATFLQMNFLARLFQQTNDRRYRDAFRKGVNFLLEGQYDNGGWPQFWPVMRDYQPHITYNDNSMYHTLTILRDIAWDKKPFDGNLVDKKLRKKVSKSFYKGIDCILKTQLKMNGKPSVWCQQYDEKTLLPASARAFELASYCTAESANLVKLLMSLPDPSDEVVRAVQGAMEWFDHYKITGYRLQHASKQNPLLTTQLVPDSTAVPLWARFYDLERCEPFVCDRDGIPRRRLSSIGKERRDGYGWYNSQPASLYSKYEQWKKKYAIQGGPRLNIRGKGGNETGIFVLFREPKVDASLFNVVVHPGESIQKAIEQAPAEGKKPFKILILNGKYHQKVIIDKPYIVLVGQNRDSTSIVFAELRQDLSNKTYHGQEVGPGVITLTEKANDCVISGLTLYNNYGSTVSPTTAHQMTIFGRATRTIVINCNIYSDGNDALALWAHNGGMYYNADLTLRCPGVDFLCPRGWCFATRCKFVGDGRAMIWHDGRMDRKAKLVITDSRFDAKSPTLLGRYHHNSQFYLLNCTLSANVLDENIHYAYSDKVLDSCSWGRRTYYWQCYREGGNTGWLNDNLETAEGSPKYYKVTAKWTFDRQWDPEKTIRELWPVLAYENKDE